MDDLERRIISLEQAAKYERERTDYHLAGLHHRLQVLETSPLRAISLRSLLKVLLAISLPLLVLLATGDLRAAIRAIRGGWPI